MSATLSLWLGVLGCLLATIASVIWMILASLSPGTVRRLDFRDRRSEHLEQMLRKRNEIHVVLRLFLVVDLLFALFCGFWWERHVVDVGGAGWLRVAPPVLAAVFYFLVSEMTGRHLVGGAAARALLFFRPFVRILGVLLSPVAFPLILLHRRIDTWQGERTVEEEVPTAEDEIMSLVESDEEQESQGGGTQLEEDERRMIRGIFDLDETLVHEVMTPRVDVDGLSETASMAEVKNRIVASGHSRLPVYRESIDQIVGVIYAKDLLNEERVSEAESLEPLYHRPVFIPETKNIGDLLAEFQQTQNHFAVVLDEYGGTAGIVTFEDLLEEIVGEIRDEYDIDEPEPVLERGEDGSLTADARTPISELLEVLDMDLPEDHDCDTLGGYISAAIGRIPEQGETVENTFFVFDILEADPRRVVKAKVTRKQTGDEAGNE